MSSSQPQFQSMPIGVVLRRTPGVTRWAKWAWRAESVLPGAAPAQWKLLREIGGSAEFHIGTVQLDLHAADSEGYLAGLADSEPSVYVVLRQSGHPEQPYQIALVTASPFEAQDYCDNGDDVVEKVPMPAGLIAWVRAFAQANYEDTPFVKRRRDRKDVDGVENGVGDARITQLTDVYRAPSRKGGAS